MSDGADFTVRLVDQMTAPAKQMQKAMRDVNKTFDVVKRSIEAPAAKRGPLSDWDRMLSKAKLSQASDFAKQNARLVGVQKKAAAGADKGGILSKLFGAVGGGQGGGLTGMIGMMGPEGAAIAAVVEGVKAVTAKVAEAVHAVVDLGVEFTEAALEAAKFAERSTLAIGFLTDNALHAGTVFDDVRHEAQSLGLDVQDTVGSFQKLLAAQFTVGESKSLIKMGADMQAIGASAEEVQRIIYAMSEIKSIGTLQKRQERMLQMAGISGQLIDQALMKRTGIKTEGGLQLARKKNRIGADVAIAAVQDAVMSKTHEKALGDTGKAFAGGTLAGMQAQLGAGLENFWIDVGQKMLPGATRIATLVAGTIGKLANDPQVAALGDFMLARWERFTNWVQTEWPQIESILIVGLHATADAIRLVVDLFDSASVPFQVLRDDVYAFAALTGSALSLLTGGIVGLPQAIQSGMASLGADMGRWLVHFVDRWGETGRDMMAALVNGILSQLGPLGSAVALVASMMPHGKVGDGMVPLPQAMQPYTELKPDTGVPASSGIGGALAALSGGGTGKTEGGHPSDGAAVHIGEMPIHVTAAAGDDPHTTGAKIGAAVRAEVAKIFETHG